MNRTHLPLWVKYAKWEETQQEYDRSRSVYERALDVDYRSHTVWLNYAEMEMRHKFINHARNVWDRAIALLPRVAQLWYKYAFMEEMLGNFAGARNVFERWMKWAPDENAWMAFVRFELRHGTVANARNVFERFIQSFPTIKAYIKYARFEERQRQTGKAREVFERLSDELPEELVTADYYLAFAKFEERAREPERARAIYKYAIENIPKAEAQELYSAYSAFERQRGDRAGVEEAIYTKKRIEYEETLTENPRNYNAWFDLARMEEANSTPERIREVYERAIAHTPPPDEKRYWRRYIYLWINYATWEELEMGDLDRARQVYRSCLKSIPDKHKWFSFSKIWLLAANLEIRRHDVAEARKLLGQALGMAPKEKIFRGYINVELALGEMDRCRRIFAKWIETNPYSVTAWKEFAEMEASLGETSRARAVLELGVSQDELDMPELLWKTYIDFEIGEDNADAARKLYDRLLEKTRHGKVYQSYAQFESTNGHVDKARKIYRDGDRALKSAVTEAFAGTDGESEGLAITLKQERVNLLKAWKDLETKAGSEEGLAEVEKKMPRKVKRKRPLLDEHGNTSGWEEYYDYVFEEDDGAAPHLKLLQAAQSWKKAMSAQQS
uniref:Pre-mRNA-splicing factor Syf1/CRNKL1-like C-terminal HAT-repeats domain-containing protein n=3 Tax=Rhodosorus marinus TaxID=101924 RepID=A0A7S2ZVE3_9RHOD|mmetsp:Transcript_32485/g.127394  ORF Transcript_32485/g.127394 Transcript_32485/m.127394 type:complete len:615 (+) Transcript_32485:222-2066(+)